MGRKQGILSQLKSETSCVPFPCWTAAGQFVLNVLLGVAQWEREAIGERTRDALQKEIRNGERCGSKIRSGYDLADDGKSLVRIRSSSGRWR